MINFNQLSVSFLTFTNKVKASMRNVCLLFVCSLLVLVRVPTAASAQVDTFGFETDEQLQRFRTLSNELRCPMCQNTNLSGSTGGVAEDLRREVERQRGSLPGAGSEAGDAAREALRRAEEAMRGAGDAIERDDLAEAIDQQAEAMDALRDGMRNLGEAMEEAEGRQGQQGTADGREGSAQRDPLGRSPGADGQAGTDQGLLQGEDVYRRARELLDEIRKRSGESVRPEIERDYLRRLLDRF